jgi:hypothetical protein
MKIVQVLLMWDKATDAALAEVDGAPKDQILQDKLAALGNKHLSNWVGVSQRPNPPRL